MTNPAMNFIKNVGFVDQIVRSLLTLDILVGYFIGILSGLGAFVAVALALVLVGSCLTGHCPLYTMLRFSTRQ